MLSTMDLLSDALAVKRGSHWCNEMDIDPSTLSQAKKRGHLSPAVAGGLARLLGQPVEKWICIAAMESEKDSAVKSVLIKEAGKTWLTSL